MYTPIDPTDFLCIFLYLFYVLMIQFLLVDIYLSVHLGFIIIMLPIWLILINYLYIFGFSSIVYALRLV